MFRSAASAYMTRGTTGSIGSSMITFFGKTIDKVRTGGIIAFITSSGTLDKASGNVRRYIAQRCELIGAVRLPSDTFRQSAGTEVTSDILFLQKARTHGGPG